MSDAVTDAQLAALAARLAAPTPAPASDVPDIGLSAGVPIAPDPVPTLDDMANTATRMALLAGTDTESGAPPLVRMAVGDAGSPADRLSTIKQHYPDAVPLPGGGNNFVYTNPATGQRQTYEPMGWRIPTAGDVASVMPEIMEGIGGTAGGLLASPGGVTTPIGVGLGAAGGKAAWNGLMQFLGMTANTATPVQQATDLATTAGLNAVLPVVGERTLGPIISSLLRPDAPTATMAAATALQRAGLTSDLPDVLPGAVQAESRPWQKVDRIVGGFPFEGGVQESYDTTGNALAGTARNIAQSAAPGLTVPNADTFANTVGAISQRITDRFALQRQDADDYAMNLIGGDTPVDLTPLRDLRTQMQGQLNAAPNVLQPRYGGAIGTINTILGDAADRGGTLPFSAIRNARTDLGKTIDWTASGADVPTGVPALQQTYGALKDTLLNTADDAGPQAYAALADHDAMVTRFNNGPAQTFADLANPDRRANTLTRMMQSTAPSDSQSLGQLTAYATAPERQQLAAGVIQQFGTKPDGSFDMPTWLQNYGKTTPTARNIMFGSSTDQDSLQTALNNLATVQQTIGKSAAYRNFPNTAPTIAVLNALSGVGTAVLSGDPAMAAKVAGGAFAAPWAAGRLMTSTPFVKWLTGTWGVNANTAGAWGNQLARLGTVAQADPSVAGLVQSLRQKLPDQLPSQQPPVTQ